jgi:hypothetical protein
MSKVIELNKFKKEQEEKRGRQPLYKSHGSSDFGDRMARIRASLERINMLMAELKKLSSDEKPTRRSDDK